MRVVHGFVSLFLAHQTKGQKSRRRFCFHPRFFSAISSRPQWVFVWCAEYGRITDQTPADVSWPSARAAADRAPPLQRGASGFASAGLGAGPSVRSCERNPGMIRFTCKYQPTMAAHNSKWCRIASIHSMNPPEQSGFRRSRERIHPPAGFARGFSKAGPRDLGCS